MNSSTGSVLFVDNVGIYDVDVRPIMKTAYEPGIPTPRCKTYFSPNNKWNTHTHTHKQPPPSLYREKETKTRKKKNKKVARSKIKIKNKNNSNNKAWMFVGESIRCKFQRGWCVASRGADCPVWDWFGASSRPSPSSSPSSVARGSTRRNRSLCPILSLPPPSVFASDYGGSVLRSKGSIPRHVSAILFVRTGMSFSVLCVLV